MKALISAVALGAFLAGPAFGEDAASIVQSLGQKWVIAYNAQDAAALAALYTKTALLLPQGVDVPLNGEAAIRKYFGDAVKQPVANMSIKATEGRDDRPRYGLWCRDVERRYPWSKRRCADTHHGNLLVRRRT